MTNRSETSISKVNDLLSFCKLIHSAQGHNSLFFILFHLCFCSVLGGFLLHDAAASIQMQNDCLWWWWLPVWWPSWGVKLNGMRKKLMNMKMEKTLTFKIRMTIRILTNQEDMFPVFGDTNSSKDGVRWTLDKNWAELKTQLFSRFTTTASFTNQSWKPMESANLTSPLWWIALLTQNIPLLRLRWNRLSRRRTAW